MQRLGARHAGLGWHELGDLAGNDGEREVQQLGIEILERRAEKGGGFGEEAGEFLLGEGRVAVPLGRGAEGRRGRAAAAHAREPGGAWLGGWGGRSGGRRARGCVSVHGVADCGLRRGRAPLDAGLSKAAGDSVAHRAAEAEEEARGNPWAGLGRKVGGVKCRCHGIVMPEN